MIRLALALLASLWACSASAQVDVEEVTSPGGIDAWLVENHDLPFVSLEILFGGGASLDVEGKRGAVHLMTGLLEEGSGDMDAQEFQRAREGLAARFGFDVSDDALSVSARVLSENRAESMDLLKQALTDPTFSEDATERVRAQVLSIIRSDAKDPQAIASAAFDKAAFDGHPYGSPLEGTVESVSGLSRDDLEEAHDNVLNRDDIYVAAVGDITADQLGELLDELLGDLPAEGPEMPPHADVATAGGATVIDFPTPQSVALFGHEGIKRDDEDFFAAYILNEILGGSGLDSILMDEVREKRGLTYGVYSYLVPKKAAELYLGSLASANGTMAEAIEVIRDQWSEVAEKGVSEKQLEEAKTYLTGAYPLRFDGNSAIADILVGMQFQGLEPEYMETRNDRIEAVSLEEINRVASELLQPEALHFFVVGQPEGLEDAEEMAPPLEAEQGSDGVSGGGDSAPSAMGDEAAATE